MHTYLFPWHICRYTNKGTWFFKKKEKEREIEKALFAFIPVRYLPHTPSFVVSSPGIKTTTGRVAVDSVMGCEASMTAFLLILTSYSFEL